MTIKEESWLPALDGLTTSNIVLRLLIGVRFICWVYFTIPGVFFFFQAEDGIRDLTVTGVQTCALPILRIRVSRTANTVDVLLEEQTYPEVAAQRAFESVIAILHDSFDVVDQLYGSGGEIGRASCRERV